MARNTIGTLPFELYTLDTNQPISQETISNLLIEHGSISLCVRSESGHPNRGGYYFHIEKYNNLVNLYDAAHTLIDTIDISKATNFINHSSGRKYDDEMLKYCQSFINFKQD